MRRYRRSVRVAVAVAAGAAALGTAAAGWAGNPSATCRLVIGKGASKLVATGYKDALACRKAADKAGQATGPCDVPGSAGFDPKGTYAGAKTNAMTLIGAKCASGDPVRGNYDANDPAGAIFPEIDSTIGGNQLTTAGNANLSSDKASIACVEAISKGEAGIMKELVGGGTKCQKAIDKTASSFGAVDPSCLLPGTKSVPKATAAINKACTGLDPTALGTCSPLPGCAIDNTISAGHDIVQAIYFKKSPASTCGNGIVEGTEQCDDGASNGTPGDLCNANCESLAATCGPGTVAGGTFIGHRIVTVSVNVPGGAELAGVQLGFDYPQLLASIPGRGNSSVVRGAVHVFPAGGLLAVNDTDTDFNLALASTTEFIPSGPVFQVTLDQCQPLSANVCNRNQNVVGCCPDADLVACNDDVLNIDDPAHFATYYDHCHCGPPFRGVGLTDCTTGWKFFAEHGPCTVGACASPPATMRCGHGCTAGGSDKVNHACSANADCFDTGVCDTGSHLCTAGGSDKVNQACNANADCFDPGVCDPDTLLCTAGEPTKVGTACAVDTDCDSAAGACNLGTNLCTAGEPTRIGTACAANADCNSVAGVCSSGNICTAGDASRIGLTCSINNDCGAPLTVATCEACPQLGDRNNGTFGCSDAFNGPICTPGHFPAAAVGGCDGTSSGPIGGCPLGNTCEIQGDITTQSCSLINPVDHLGQPVADVTCHIDVMEAP